MNVTKSYTLNARDGDVILYFESLWDGETKILNQNDIFLLSWSASDPRNNHEEEALEGFELIQKHTAENTWILAGYVNPEGAQGNCFVYIATAYNYDGNAYTGGGWNYNGTVTCDGIDHDFDGLGTTQYYDTFPKYFNMYGGSNNEIHLNFNFPIFDTEEHWESYIVNGTLDGCLNAENEFGEDTEEYYLYTRYAFGTAKNGQVTYSGVNTGFFERILCNGRICLKKTAEPNQYIIVAQSVVGSAFSSINQYTVEQIEPGDFEDGLISSGPIYDIYHNSYGDGSFTLGLYDLKSMAITNIPFFSDPEKADDYIGGTGSIEDADNFSYISGGAGIDTNPTGTPEEVTQTSLNLSRGVFAADYCMSRSGLVSLASDFFADGFWDAIKEGLRYYGNNPMSSVMNCTYFPFDVSQIFDIVGTNFVGFGGYQHDVTGYGISKIAFNKGLKELGQTYIRPTFNNFLDFEAVDIYLFLPYIGFVQLQPEKYTGKTLKIQYAIDIHSGECCAMLFANGTLMDTYDGQCGIQQPITSEDLSGYLQAQLTGIKSAAGNILGGGISGAMAGAKGGMYGAIAGAAVGSGLGAASAAVTAYGLSHMKPQLFSSGGYSGALGANLPQYAFLIFAIHETEEPANLIQTYGKPSNKSGNVGNFSGFLSVNSVNLFCGDATDEEKQEILSMLHSGVII